MNFIFISPDFPKSYFNFCRELKNLGINVLGISQNSYYSLSNELKESLTDFYQVNNMEWYDDVYRAVAYFASKYGKIDYIESNNEYWLELEAKLRTDFNVTSGKKDNDIKFFKSKEAMKVCYKKARVPVARFIIPTTLEEGIKFIEEVGYPVIVKPDNGVGAYNTYKINNYEELERFYKYDFPPIKYIMEEYINGELISFDGISDNNCEPVLFSNEVFPTPVMELVHSQGDVFYYSNKDCPKDLEKVGRRVLKGFNARNRYFHLEFFRLNEDKVGLGKKGDILGLEVNMRCPGGYTPDMINFARSANTYRVWAETLAWGVTNEDMSHPKYYCGYYARRYQNHYNHSSEDIMNRFSGKIVMHEQMPEVLSGAMGNDAYFIKTDSFEELMEFKKYCSE